MINSPCCQNSRSGNTARPWTYPASIILKPGVQRILKEHRNSTILEIGPGCLRNALFLQKQGFKVQILSDHPSTARFPTQHRLFRNLGGKCLERMPPKSSYKIILTTFVLETICDPIIRGRLARFIFRSLQANGIWILSVRGPRNIVLKEGTFKRCSDGFFTNQRTFVRSFTKLQLKRFLNQSGFKNLTFLHRPWVMEPELLDVIAYRKDDSNAR